MTDKTDSFKVVTVSRNRSRNDNHCKQAKLEYLYKIQLHFGELSYVI